MMRLELRRLLIYLLTYLLTYLLDSTFCKADVKWFLIWNSTWRHRV